MRCDRINIVAYDPQWPLAFARERDRLEAGLDKWLAAPVEHIGSTAVPGLPAKPIIDMLALTQDRDSFQDALPAARELGWVHAPEPADEEDLEWSLCFPDIAYRSHHLHVLEHASPRWPLLLAFRDHLRRNPDLAADYGQIKLGLARHDNQDRVRYRAGKAPFIRHVLRQIEETGG
jgi:GrpB-like predicted nucleotidyltransferase (UPF0157 family)